MDFGIHFLSNDRSLDPAPLARAVEAGGFESLFLGEHTHIPASRESPYPGIADKAPRREEESDDEFRARRPDLRSTFWYLYDPFISLSAAASVTERIKLGTAICLVAERDPLVLAQEISTLDRISNGRVVLGIGTGWNREEMANHGVAFEDRFAVTRERVLAMKALWANEQAEFHGEFVDFDPVWSYPQPAQPGGPKVLLGENRKRSFDRIVDYADGWLPNRARVVLDELPAQLAQLRKQTEAAERSYEELSINIYAPSLVQTPEAEVEREVRQLIEIGVDRVIFNLGSPRTVRALGVIEEHAEFIRRFE